MGESSPADREAAIRLHAAAKLLEHRERDDLGVELLRIAAVDLIRNALAWLDGSNR